MRAHSRSSLRSEATPPTFGRSSRNLADDRGVDQGRSLTVRSSLDRHHVHRPFGCWSDQPTATSIEFSTTHQPYLEGVASRRSLMELPASGSGHLRACYLRIS